MGEGRPARVRGFTLPLTMVLAFSLMTLATGIVGMVAVSDKQAKTNAEDLVATTTLESAIEQSLFGLEKDGAPQTSEWTDRQTLNGLDVSLILAPDAFKPDLIKSKIDDVGVALSDADLRQRVLAALAPPTPKDDRRSFSRFSEFVRAVGADPAEEDCLRRRLTIGRETADTQPVVPDTGLIPPRAPLSIGEIIDVRAETRDGYGRREVLWRRVRFTGKPERVWLTHDWREMRLPRAETDCPLVIPVPPASGAATGR